MNKVTWNKFVKARERFKQEVENISASLPKLRNIQQELVDSRSEVTYKIETPVVYNTALDEIAPDDEIKMILTADNPGRREQAAENRRYLVGPSGKIAKKFFIDNPSLDIDFTKNVIILNKTPIHTPRTIELKELCKFSGRPLAKTPRRQDENENLVCILEDSQRVMADLLYEFYKAFECPVWIIGYSEMRKNGIFEVYTEKLKEICNANRDFYRQICFYRHFSMNQFTVDLRQKSVSGETVSKSLKRIGKDYRERILGG
ncbi:MAG: hypothetical protein FWC01_05610 [Treponema sp.]|nr:hypothetical protein [Treponema sp.]